jgi:hypothetical protein
VGYLQDTSEGTAEEAINRSEEAIADSLDLGKERVDLRNDRACGRNSGGDEGDEGPGDGGGSRNRPLEFRSNLIESICFFISVRYGRMDGARQLTLTETADDSLAEGLDTGKDSLAVLHELGNRGDLRLAERRGANVAESLDGGENAVHIVADGQERLLDLRDGIGTGSTLNQGGYTTFESVVGYGIG